MENRSYEETFTKKIISTGRWTILTAVVLCFLPAIYLWIRYGAIPSVKNYFNRMVLNRLNVWSLLYS